jgi:hypothetical protein
MVGAQIRYGFIDFAKTNFDCPNCNKIYNDRDDKYLERCQRNKKGITKIKCGCGIFFYMTYDYKGDAVSFIPNKKSPSLIEIK